MDFKNMSEKYDEQMFCPKCGSECDRDVVNVGVGFYFGPFGCACGWSEYAEYDISDGPKIVDGLILDQYGGGTPISKETPNER